MKHKKTILAVGAGLLALFLVFAWLFWGSKVPEPTGKSKNPEDTGVKATVHNTKLHREEKGKRLWELKVDEAVQLNDDLIEAKKLEGIVYLSNGDEMYVKADSASIKAVSNDFVLKGGVTARLKRGGFLKAKKVEWKQNEDIITATGAVRVIKEDMLATAEKIVTSSEFKHFKLIKKAHVERGGHYEEK